MTQTSEQTTGSKAADASPSANKPAKRRRKRRMAREPEAEDTSPPAADDTPRSSKISMVMGLLVREEGATLDEMIAATGWQPHSTRAALTGLRKKGYTIAKSKRGDVTCYRITDKA